MVLAANNQNPTSVAQAGGTYFSPVKVQRWAVSGFGLCPGNIRVSVSAVILAFPSCLSLHTFEMITVTLTVLSALKADKRGKAEGVGRAMLALSIPLNQKSRRLSQKPLLPGWLGFHFMGRRWVTRSPSHQEWWRE